MPDATRSAFPPLDRHHLGFDAVWFRSRPWACELPDPHSKLYDPIVDVLDGLGYRHDLRLSQDKPESPSAGRRYRWWYGYVLRCRPPRHLDHLLPQIHVRYGPSDSKNPLLQVRVFPTVHAELDLDLISRLLRALANVVFKQLRWRHVLQVDLAELFEVSLLELAWDWPLYSGRIDEVAPHVHVPYARQTSIEDVPYEGRYRWGSPKSGAPIFVGYTKVEDGLAFRRWERRIRRKTLHEAGIRFVDDLPNPAITDLYTARFPAPYSRWLTDAVGRFRSVQLAGTAPSSVPACTTATTSSQTGAVSRTPHPHDPRLVRATYGAEHQVVERFWARELTPVIGAPAAERLSSGIPLFTQAERLAVTVSSAKVMNIFENVAVLPDDLRAGERPARRHLAQLRRQVPQHIHDLRMALRTVRTARECRALVACLDAAVQLQRALDRWLVEERNDSVKKQLRGVQKQKTNVTSVIQQVEHYHQLIDRVRRADSTHPDDATRPGASPSACCSSISAAYRGGASASWGSPLSRAGRHQHRSIRAEGVLRVLTPSCAALAGLGGVLMRGGCR